MEGGVLAGRGVGSKQLFQRVSIDDSAAATRAPLAVLVDGQSASAAEILAGPDSHPLGFSIVEYDSTKFNESSLLEASSCHSDASGRVEGWPVRLCR